MSDNFDIRPEISGPVSTMEQQARNFAQELWKKAALALKSDMNPEIYDLWLKPILPLSYGNNQVVLEVPNKFFGDWIRENCLAKIETLLQGITSPETRVEIVYASSLPDSDPLHAASALLTPTVKEPAAEAPVVFMEQFNTRYTFETFVEGQSNRFAKAAAEGVAKEPGIRFNPLFLYGGVGLGKTHLMHAIGHTIRQTNPQARILYITSEKFINEFIDSLRFERPADFRNKYRNVDCLLIDDIQFLIGKGRSEEEFFYTFNSLFDSRKQIVICSDRSPKDMGTLQDRLISRFEWGVVADIQPPDLETRIAILRKKAELDRIFVPEDVILFVASQVRSNIRELEGSLIRIVAYSSLTGTPLTVDTARETLKDIANRNNDEKPISIDVIQEIVAKHFHLEPRDLKSKKRTDAIAWPRQIAMYLCRTLTELSTTEIGDYFGGKDHTTVLHACEKVKLKLAESPFISSMVNKITQDIKNENSGEVR